MNTKTFAQQARTLLMDGVSRKLIYWGFSPSGEVLEQPDVVSGGYTFRGDAYDDDNVPALWQSLKKAVQKKGIEVVVEEAAYTWFNRLMAIRILAKNGYDLPQLDFADGLNNTPIILQKARQGQYDFLNATEQTRLQRIIGDYNKENDAFALLLVGYCHSHNTLNKVFGKLDDYTELLLPDNMLQDQGFLNLLNTTDAISDDEYKEVELIGWLYQFYISERKDEVFASFKKKKKAEAKDIPAATQIFTPNWIVKYMVENTAGKIWLDHKPDSPIKDQMKYLVTNDNNNVSSSAVENENKSIINDLEQLTLIDPACGSGHILVEGFDLLYKMYQEEYYTPEEAVQTIFAKNLYGLDIDDRAAQLATFAVLLKAAQVYPDVWSKGWQLNIYAMPETNSFSTQEVTDFLGEEGKDYIEEVEKALQLMQQAKNLGSVMQLNLSDASLALIRERFEFLQTQEHLPFELQTIKPKLERYIPVLITLSRKFTAVVANPPYMGQKSMNGKLKDYVNTVYPKTKSDLMTIFMEVIPNMTLNNARFALINLPSWLFLSSFEKIRSEYIENYSFDSLLHMGRGIFGIDFGSVAFAVQKSKIENAIGSYFRLHERNFQHIHFEDIHKLFLYSNGDKDYKYDFKQYRGEDGITEIPTSGTEIGKQLFYPRIPQANFKKIPGSPIAYFLSNKVVQLFESQKPLNSFADVKVGLQTGDNNRFRRNWTEVSFTKTSITNSNSKWFPYNSGGDFRKWYGNQLYLVDWENQGFRIRNFTNELGRLRSRPQNITYYMKPSISWSKIAAGGLGVRYFPEGFIFDVAGCSIFETKPNTNIYLLGLLNSKLKTALIESIAPTINYEVGQISNVPVR
ncbi:BREX-1 system adenine-specific DNA-methyltransferase PglX, partial [Nonlabens ulvanivorans]